MSVWLAPLMIPVLLDAASSGEKNAGGYRGVVELKSGLHLGIERCVDIPGKCGYIFDIGNIREQLRRT